MDIGSKTANDLLSKDFNKSISACDFLINHKDFHSFEKLVNASEMIFPFLIEKINKNLLSRVTKDNFKNLFEFMKLYSYEFETFIVDGLVKFASQDLTDDVFEILENGSEDEKTYCALYFSKVHDEIALDILREYALSENDNLAQNCAIALSSFNDRELYNKALKIINETNSEDFINNIKYINFLINYGDSEALPILFNYLKTSKMSACMLPNLLNLLPYRALINDNKIDIALGIYQENLSAYPEIMSLSTIEQFEIFDLIDYLFKIKNPTQIQSILILQTKIKFELFKSEDIYSYGLSKNEKEYLNKIFNYVSSKDDSFYQSHIDNLDGTFKEKTNIDEVLQILSELNCNIYNQDIVDFINTSQDETLICESIKALKNLGSLHLLDKEKILLKIYNNNIKAIIESYFD